MIKEDSRIESARFGAGRDISSGSQVIKVAFDFLLAHLIGMALTIEEDERTYPVDIGLFRSMTEMFLLAGDSDMIKKTGFAWFCWVAS